MSEKKKRDPLLVTAKVGTILVRIGLTVGMIGLGIAGAVTVFKGGIPPEGLKVAVEGTELNEITGAVLLIMMSTLISLGLAFEFTTRLAQIIDTVGEGDPFTLENAGRLRRMGWLAIIIQAIAVPAMLLSQWVRPQLSEHNFSVTSDFSFTGIGLAIVLFILARVFRQGTEMRDDLEGTV